MIGMNGRGKEKGKKCLGENMKGEGRGRVQRRGRNRREKEKEEIFERE